MGIPEREAQVASCRRKSRGRRGTPTFFLVPAPRDPSLLELSTKLRVSGTLLDAKVSPDTDGLIETGAKALSYLAVGPLGLLAPFANLGAHQKSIPAKFKV